MYKYSIKKLWSVIVRMFNLMAMCGDKCVRLNRYWDNQYASHIVFVGIVALALFGVLGGVVGAVAEQYANLCDIARERKGAVNTMEQNRCNGATDGRLMADDWACRNDGYSGYNVASVGESE